MLTIRYAASSYFLPSSMFQHNRNMERTNYSYRRIFVCSLSRLFLQIFSVYDVYTCIYFDQYVRFVGRKLVSVDIYCTVWWLYAADQTGHQVHHSLTHPGPAWTVFLQFVLRHWWCSFNRACSPLVALPIVTCFNGSILNISFSDYLVCIKLCRVLLYILVFYVCFYCTSLGAAVSAPCALLFSHTYRCPCNCVYLFYDK